MTLGLEIRIGFGGQLYYKYTKVLEGSKARNCVSTLSRPCYWASGFKAKALYAVLAQVLFGLMRSGKLIFSLAKSCDKSPDSGCVYCTLVFDTLNPKP